MTRYIKKPQPKGKPTKPKLTFWDILKTSKDADIRKKKL